MLKYLKSSYFSNKMMDLVNIWFDVRYQSKVSKFPSFFYTPDIRSMWGYIVFAFPFVRSFVRTYVRLFVSLSVTGSKFLRESL